MRSRPQYSVTKDEVHGYANPWLSSALRLEYEGTKCTARTLLQVLHKGPRYTLALTRVEYGEKRKDVVQRPLEISLVPRSQGTGIQVEDAHLQLIPHEARQLEQRELLAAACGRKVPRKRRRRHSHGTGKRRR